MLSIGVLEIANEEERGVLLQVFSRAMALVRSRTVSKTKNCLLAAAGTFCNKKKLQFCFCLSLQNDQFAVLRGTVSHAAVSIAGKSIWKKRRARNTG